MEVPTENFYPMDTKKSEKMHFAQVHFP